MEVKEVTDERISFSKQMLQAQAPYSKTDYFEINKNIIFVRTYDLTNKTTPFYFSFSQRNRMPVSDELILEVMNSNLIHQQLIHQFKIQETISENNVTHIYPVSKKQKEEN